MGLSDPGQVADLLRAGWPLTKLKVQIPDETYAPSDYSTQLVSTKSGRLLRGLRGAGWPALASLELGVLVLTPAAAQLLVSCSLPALEVLRLEGQGMKPCPGEAADPPHLTPLQVLAQGRWPALRCLALQGQRHLAAPEAAALASADWPRLEELDLRGSILLFGRELVAAVEAAGWTLRRLDLSGSWFDDARAELLAGAGWEGLEAVDLSSDRLTPRGAEALAGARWPCLRRLSLALNMTLGDAGAAALARGVAAAGPGRPQYHGPDPGGAAGPGRRRLASAAAAGAGLGAPPAPARLGGAPGLGLVAAAHRPGGQVGGVFLL